MSWAKEAKKATAALAANRTAIASTSRGTPQGADSSYRRKRNQKRGHIH